MSTAIHSHPQVVSLPPDPPPGGSLRSPEHDDYYDILHWAGSTLAEPLLGLVNGVHLGPLIEDLRLGGGVDDQIVFVAHQVGLHHLVGKH